MDIKKVQEWYDLKNLVNPKHNTPREEAKHILEEAGEVLEAVCNREMIWSTQGHKAAQDPIAEEIADLIITACVLANRLGINVPDAIERKTMRNIREGKITNLTLEEIK